MGKRLTTALTLGLLALAAPPGASATFPGDNGPIAYRCGGDICVVDPDGATTTKLAGRPGFESHPSFSAGGSRIVFSREDRSGAINLYRMRADGSRKRRLTRSPDGTSNLRAGFSPDGNSIVFERLRRRGRDGIFIMGAGGSNVTYLGEGSSPSFSPDGRLIAFDRRNRGTPGRRIYTMAPDGSAVTVVTAADDEQVTSRSPSFAPDGERIVFVRSLASPDPTGVYSIRADGSGLTLLHAARSFPYNPAMSPDGTQLAFGGEDPERCEGGECQPVLLLAPVGGGDATPLVDVGGQVDNRADWGVARVGSPSLDCAGRSATITGTPRADVIRGTAGRDVIAGAAGADVIRGTGGDDVLCGGRGRDRVIGGPGEDRCRTGRGKDQVRGCEL